MKKRVIIRCTEKQMLILECALETLVRITMGQLEQIVNSIELMRHKSLKAKVNDEIYEGYALGSYISDLIKPILFPELSRHASYGVGQEQIGDAQIAYEMLKKIQNFRSRRFKNPGVLAHEPLHYSKEPLIDVDENNI